MPTSHFASTQKKAWDASASILRPRDVIRRDDLPKHWGLLELRDREIHLVVKPGRIDLRSPAALMKEMNLLLASLRRVELRIEPQSITDFLKWKNRMADYNGGTLPVGVVPAEEESNAHLQLSS